MANCLAKIARAGLLLALACTGCSNKLATGYKPRLLGDSDIRRRGYYADQFTTQAKAAEQEQKSEADQRKPKAGY
jgi:hypothetical protein